MEFELESEIAHLWQGHENWHMSLLDDVKLRGLDNVLLVVHAYNQLLVALGRLGIRKGELRRGLSDVVPNTTIGIVIAELHQVLRCHSRSHRSSASQIQNHRGRRKGLSDE